MIQDTTCIVALHCQQELISHVLHPRRGEWENQRAQKSKELLKLSDSSAIQASIAIPEALVDSVIAYYGPTETPNSPNQMEHFTKSRSLPALPLGLSWTVMVGLSSNNHPMTATL